MSITVGEPVGLPGILVGPPIAVVASGGGLTGYTHTQTIPATVWVVQHNLGRRPAAVSAFSDDWSQQWAEFNVHHVDSNLLYISADVAISGKALVE